VVISWCTRLTSVGKSKKPCAGRNSGGVPISVLGITERCLRVVGLDLCLPRGSRCERGGVRVSFLFLYCG